MTKLPPTKVLLVEGNKDKRIIPELIASNGIQWEKNPNPHLVDIQAADGNENLLEAGFIEAKIKERGRTHLGIVLDADTNLSSIWQSVRNRCLPEFPALPTDLPPNGLIETNGRNQKPGIWIMPDNQSHGMMETFLQFLVPNQNERLFELAKSSCTAAKTQGAIFKDVHTDKANIYTWLAWQDEPGYQLHEAVRFKILDAKSELCRPFVTWFCQTFDVSLPSATPHSQAD